jgi:hypothetical protein
MAKYFELTNTASATNVAEAVILRLLPKVGGDLLADLASSEVEARMSYDEDGNAAFVTRDSAADAEHDRGRVYNVCKCEVVADYDLAFEVVWVDGKVCMQFEQEEGLEDLIARAAELLPPPAPETLPKLGGLFGQLLAAKRG